MENAVGVLTNTVTGEALWGVVGTAVPYIAVIVIFAFGYGIVKKMVKGLSRGKAKI